MGATECEGSFTCASSINGAAFKGTCPRVSMTSLALSGWYSCMCSENLGERRGEGKGGRKIV